jgi:uncharacterized protein YbjT (DUF2867 family)
MAGKIVLYGATGFVGGLTEGNVITARELLEPAPQRFAAGRRDPAAPDLTGHGVQIVGGDLSTVDVKPFYDGHYGDLLTLLKCADALSVR